MSGVSRHSIAREGRRWHRSRGRILTRSRSRSRRWSCKSHAVFFSFSRVGWVSRFQVARWMRYQIHSNTTPLTLVVSLFVPVWYQHQSIHFSRWVWVLPHAITAISLRNPNFLAARLPQTALTHSATLVPNRCRTKPARSAKQNLPESSWDMDNHSYRGRVPVCLETWILLPKGASHQMHPNGPFPLSVYQFYALQIALRCGPGIWVLTLC